MRGAWLYGTFADGSAEHRRSCGRWDGAGELHSYPSVLNLLVPGVFVLADAPTVMHTRNNGITRGTSDRLQRTPLNGCDNRSRMDVVVLVGASLKSRG